MAIDAKDYICKNCSLWAGDRCSIMGDSNPATGKERKSSDIACMQIVTHFRKGGKGWDRR